MSPEQRYFFDLTGYLHLRNVISRRFYGIAWGLPEVLSIGLQGKPSIDVHRRPPVLVPREWQCARKLTNGVTPSSSRSSLRRLACFGPSESRFRMTDNPPGLRRSRQMDQRTVYNSPPWVNRTCECRQEDALSNLHPAADRLDPVQGLDAGAVFDLVPAAEPAGDHSRAGGALAYCREQPPLSHPL